MPCFHVYNNDTDSMKPHTLSKHAMVAKNKLLLHLNLYSSTQVCDLKFN